MTLRTEIIKLSDDTEVHIVHDLKKGIITPQRVLNQLRKPKDVFHVKFVLKKTREK